MTKLNQVLAIEKGVKSRTYAEATEIYKQLQKPSLFEGMTKDWQKLDEENGEDRPSERKKVQLRVEDLIDRLWSSMTEIFDVTAQKDFANCQARADVTVDGVTLVSAAPVTYLLFLEKQLKDIKDEIKKLPTLSSDDDWRKGEDGLFRTDAVRTQSTKKVQKPIVLYPATEKHPAQTQLVTEDVVVGHWLTSKQSGATTADRKKELLTRCDALSDAVKSARETANSCDAPTVSIGDKILGFIFE